MGQAAHSVAAVEKRVASQGRVFPGPVEVPPVFRGEEKDNMIKAAMAETDRWEQDRDVLWTDGSRLDSGGVGGGVTWYEKVIAEEPLVVIGRRGMTKFRKREGKGHTY